MIDDEDRWPIAAAMAADAKKGERTIILRVGEILAITDAFVITSAPNTPLVRTIADEIERQLTESGGPKPLRIEGLDDLRWVLLDYGSFVVHVFLHETRDFYELERLWADVPRIEWEDSPIVGRRSAT